MSTVKLFIDDLRMPSQVGLKDADFLIVRDPFEARQAIHKYKPQYIAFDHDLGVDSYTMKIHKTGYDIAKWMTEQDQDRDAEYITEDFKFSVHSANPVGAENITKLLNGYMKFKFGT